MQTKPLQIAKLHTPNNIFLAPLAGYTNAIFRDMCYQLGAGLTVSEMVSAKGLCYNSQGTKELLYVTPDYAGIKAVQLFGCDPSFMERASCSPEVQPFDLIDINMGCPMPKIYNNGEGCALLNNMPLAEKVIKAVKKSGKAVSVKFRIGVDQNHIVTRDFAKMCEDSGADLITIHGRTKDKIYAGDVNYEQIALAKQAVSIPVIANGGVFDEQSATELLTQTGADGIAIARGAMERPWLFAELTGTPYDLHDLVLWQLHQTHQVYGERFAIVFMRKMIAFYIKGRPNASHYKTQLFACTTIPQIEAMWQEICQR